MDVYGDELKVGECGCRKELWVERRREEGIRWKDRCVSVERQGVPAASGS